MSYPPQGVVTRGEVAANIATHAALPSVHHVKYTNEEALAAAIAGGLNKIIWLAEPVRVVKDDNRSTILTWTDLDLTESTSENAKYAILLLTIDIESCTPDWDAQVQVRRNGDTPTYYSRLYLSNLDGYVAYGSGYEFCLIGLDSGRVIEYQLTKYGTVTWHSRIIVLGYIE